MAEEGSEGTLQDVTETATTPTYDRPEAMERDLLDGLF